MLLTVGNQCFYFLIFGLTDFRTPQKNLSLSHLTYKPMATGNNKKQTSTFITILWVGFLAGVFDADGALIWGYKTSPVVIFQYIASGVFGKAAFTGGDG